MNTTMDGTRARAFRPEQADRLGTGTVTPGWDLATERRIDDGETLANGLGWFSIGLGLAEVLAPQKLAGALGMEDRSELIRLYGLREIATGVGILAKRTPTGWVWARVAGDLLDLATLATALTPRNPKRTAVIGAAAAVAGVALLDVLAGKQLGQPRRKPARQRD